MSDLATAKTSILTAALESAWADIQSRHPEIPDVVIVVGPVSLGGKRADRYGHFAQGRWNVNGQRRHEVLISAEGLNRSPRQVFRTLLHESVHASCCVRGLQDTSRGGSYHNGTFAAEAEAFGCQVCKDARIGHTTPDITDEAAEEYAETIAHIEGALLLFRSDDMEAFEEAVRVATMFALIIGHMVDPRMLALVGTAHRLVPAAPRRRTTVGVSGRNPSKASCGCRSIRVQESVLALGPITCGACGEEFTLA